jgi:hypothetical protein
MSGRSVTIQGLTISNGLAPEFGCGAGILHEGSSLLLTNCTVSGNSTAGNGGASALMLMRRLRSTVAPLAVSTPGIMEVP